MTYHSQLADCVREYLSNMPGIEVEEKAMFGGYAFMVNSKMCINVGNNQLMCRFDPDLTDELAERPGFLPMTMKGRKYRGYCYVDPVGYEKVQDFEFWINLCLDFNETAKSSKSRGKKARQ